MRAAKLLAAAFLAFPAWNAFAQALPPYKMIDSGFPVDVVSAKDIQWIDDDRVLFRGVVLGNSKGGYGTAPHVWDTKQNNIQRYDGKSPLQDCCKPHADKPAAVQLLEKHGWLDVSGSNIVLHPDATAPAVETAIPKQAGSIEVAYLPWANQYLVIGNAGASAKANPAAWYLRPDGTTTEVKWPPGEWQAASSYLATRRGLLVWARQGADPKTAVYGHFLLTGGVATRIAWGYYWRGTTVSPDGCKVAFRHAVNRDDERRGYAEWKAGRPANTLRMIDVCAPARAARAASSASPK